VWGGWDGHTPRETGEIFAEQLRRRGVAVRVENSLQPLTEPALASQTDLIVPIWTMGEMSADQWKGVHEAVRSGVGLAGVHGGMGDAFRGRVEYQWMVGGQFLGHPHVGEYTVRLTGARSPITRGMKRRFAYVSEQYYMQVDPAVRVLAVTTYRHEGATVTMPVVWTKRWGKGRVFYSALGHVADEFRKYPHVLDMTVRGMLWAAR
jgi:type 1 glutamine amidotransferase